MSAIPSPFDRRKATRRLITLALPIYGAQMAQMGISTCAIVLAGRSNTVDLAAVSLSANLWVPIYVLINGTIMGLTPVVAQLRGANRIGEVREQVHQSGWIALVLGIVTALLLVTFAPEILRLMHVADDVLQAARTYLVAAAAGIPALALFQTLRSCSEGLNHTRPALWCALTSLILSIPLGIWLVFGGLGVPPMGALGCGITTAFSMWCDFLIMLLYTRRSRIFSPIELWQHGIAAPCWKTCKHLIKLGLPIGISVFSEVVLFAVVALMIATYGTIAIAAHEVAINITALLFMAPMSLGMALTIRVGLGLGEGNAFLARKESLNGLRVAFVLAMINAFAVLILGRHIVSLYTNQSAVIDLAVVLLGFAMMFQISDSLQATLAGALRGYKDTQAVMMITLFSYWVVGLGTGIPLGYGIPGLFTGFGIYGFWGGLILALTASALLLFWRVRFTARNTLQRQLLPEAP